MNEEELKKLCKEEFLKNIKENIKSETIFTYVDGLEKENKKQKEVLDKIKNYLEEPNRDNFDFSKAKILEMIEELYD